MIPITTVKFGPEEERAVLEVLRSGSIAQGPKVALFEDEFARMHGVSHAIAVNNGTTALVAALQALQLEPGDEVVTSPFTFVATLNAILEAGATATFADITFDDFNLDPASVRQAVGPKTKVLMPVHLYGQMADMGAIAELASEKQLRILEDAAQAHGATFEGRFAGSYGLGTFSLYATKNLTTGEGGCAVTQDDEIAERIGLLSLHGMNRDAWKRYTAAGSWYYEITVPGYKYNLSDVLAAIGIGQLERFDEFQRRRRELVALYDRRLAEIPEVRRPVTRPDVEHAWHLYPIALELERLSVDRGRFIQELRAENIGTSVHFIPIHLHPHFRDTLAGGEGRFPVAENAYRRAITLPLFPRMEPRDVEDVCAAVEKVAAHFRR